MAAALTVYGNRFSIATMRVLACIHQKGLPSSINTPIINPAAAEENSVFGEVPALTDGALKIYGSRAITNYLARQYADKGTPLIPSDGAKMGAMFELMDMEVRRLDPLVSKLAWETRMRAVMEMESSEGDEATKEQLGRVLDSYEERIKKLKYFEDNNNRRENRNIITLADVNHMPVFYYLSNTSWLHGLLEKRPTVKEWSKFILRNAGWGMVEVDAAATHHGHAQPNTTVAP